MSLLAGLAIRSSIVLFVGLVLDASLRHRSAALRHLVLAAAVAAAVLVGPVSLALPAWEVSLPAPWAVAPRPAAEARDVVRRASASGPTPTPARAGARVSPAAIVWFAGFVLTATTLLTGVARLRRLAARATRVQDPRWAGIAATVAAGYGLRRAIVILQTDTPDLLATWGSLRPHILLPAHAREWSDDRIHVVLCHELAHVRRHDWVVQMSAEALRTILWFNPLVWITCTRLRRESEQACDDAVLGRGVSARAYAAHLLELARKCRRPGFPWVSAMPMAHPSTLERRIAAMLNPRLDRRALSRRAIAATAALLLAVTLPTAALRAGQSAPATLAGSVYDPTGAVLPGVELTLEDANQLKWPVVSDAAGRFEFPGIQPGRYVLAASLAGFRPLRHEFELKTSRDWDRAVMLQVGEVSESITVRESRLAAPPPSSRPQGAPPIRVGGNIRVPLKLQDVRPAYPAAMRAAGREGVVPIEAIIDRDGMVSSVRVLSAQVHPDFAIAAADAVRQWRFSPTLLNGVPVEVVMTVKVAFNLSD
jgi:TonB family protein